MDQLSASRRDFARVIAALAVPTTVLADEPAPKPKPTDPAEAMLEVVRARYGKYLDDDQLAAVKRTLNRQVARGNRLRQAKLTNGDEPAFVFSVTP